MIQDFIIFYFVFWWVMSILTKDNMIQNKIGNIAKWFKSRSIAKGKGNEPKTGMFFSSLSGCMFCIENHTATIMAIGYAYYCQDIRILIWGFLCASINSWIREFIG